MINVTIGESKTQSEKPFPKLMTSELGQILYAFGLNESRSDLIVGVLLRTNGYAIGKFNYSESWSRHNFTDFNELITIQNA